MSQILVETLLENAMIQFNDRGQLINHKKENIKKFWNWFNDSKVVDALGKPKVAYHGTARINPIFRDDRSCDMCGAYFTLNAEEASDHAEMDSEVDGDSPYLIPVYLKITNPVYDIDMLIGQQFDAKQKNEWIKQGFDGIITDLEIVTFFAFQIISIFTLSTIR